MDTDRDFNIFMRRVDAYLEANIGFSSDDLPDVDYRSMFEDEIEPREAAAIACEDAAELGDDYRELLGV